MAEWHDPSHRFDYGVDRKWNREQAWIAENFLRWRYGYPLRGRYTDKADPGWDLRVNARMTIDVKWSRHHTSPLRLNVTVKAIATVFVLVTGVDMDKVIQGFAWRRTLLTAPVVDPGYGLCYTLQQGALHRNVDLLFASQGVYIEGRI